MTTYLTIMITILVATQMVRIIQNAISLHRQEKEIKKNIAWVKDVELTPADFENQKEVYKLLRERLEKDNAD